jgi:hypothetical protein
MIKICKEKGIDAHELDVCNLSNLKKVFDCIWAMDCLVHVLRPDLPLVLRTIDAILSENGLFYMGVYGGFDVAGEFKDNCLEMPRFCSFHSERKIKKVLQDVFDIISFEQISIEGKMEFDSIFLRKKCI